MINFRAQAPEPQKAKRMSPPKVEATPTRIHVQPVVYAVAIAISLTSVLRLLFFHFSQRIWAFSQDFPLELITPWSRWTMADRDGVETQVLLLLTLLLVTLTVVATKLVDKVSTRWRLVAAALCLIGCGTFLAFVPFAPPMAQVSVFRSHVLIVVGSALLITAAIHWAGQRRTRYSLLFLLLIPICFLTASPEAMSSDLECILAPALRLRLGFPLREIYFQYDLFPSLIAVGWQRLGANPAMFSFCTRTSYFLLLIGGFFLARRLFVNQRLAALFLAALCAVRIYGVMDEANAYPQVTPLRIDLWIVLLAAALNFGLEHWVVGLAIGLVFFFLRSFGMLYIGSYGLALIAEFCARRTASQEPQALLKDIAASCRRVLPSLALIALGVGAARLVFGSIVSDAVLIYHRLGAGMIRIAPSSFYWWVAPGIAVAAALAFECRQLLSDKRAQAAFFAVALAIGNVIYFFGRSHENNLMVVSASLLLCFFLCFDLAAISVKPGQARKLVLTLPWLVLTVIAYFYSGRIFAKVGDQAAAVAQVPVVFKSPQIIVCAEINAAASDRRVFIFSYYDYWFYEQCGYVPQGYIQPLFLQFFRGDIIAQMNGLLDQGYKVVVPKVSSPGFDWAELAPDLKGTYQLETADYVLYGRRR